MSALHAVDLDDEALRKALVSTVIIGSMNGKRGAVSAVSDYRAAAIVDAVYEVLGQVCEDLEPTLARLRADTARATAEALTSGGRRAALEHRLGIERAVRGEVLE